jgi:hypothetical protein
MGRKRELPEWIVVVPLSAAGAPIAAAVEGLFPRAREVAESLAATYDCPTTLLRLTGGQYQQTGNYPPRCGTGSQPVVQEDPKDARS